MSWVHDLWRRHLPGFLLWLARCAGLAAVVGGLVACSALRPAAAVHSAFFLLDPQLADQAPSPGSKQTGTRGGHPGPTLVVTPLYAAPGFDSARIIYLREAHKLEYFAQSEWVDPPARMLGAPLVAALAGSGAFGAVVLAPGSAAGDFRLDASLLRLQQDFRTRPSQVRLTLRANLVDEKTRQILAWREFDVSVPATSEDPTGGVAAANEAARVLLLQLAAFCAEAVR